MGISLKIVLIMQKFNLLFGCWVLGFLLVYSQIKIGDNPTEISPYALLELNSSQQGLLLPRMTLEQRIQAFTEKTPIGLMIYNTTHQTIEIFQGAEKGWQELTYTDQLPSAQNLQLVSNTLRLEPAGGAVDLQKYLDNQDEQTLTVEEFELSISGGNSVSLAHIREPNTDQQRLSLDGSTLSISQGNAIDLSQLSNQVSYSLSYDSGILALSNANSVQLPEPVFKKLNDVVSNQTLADEDFVFGSTQLDNIVGLEDNARMFFDKSKGAFRAGQSSTSEWDASNVGDKSIAMGYRARAKGDRSFAVGDQARAEADWATAIGDEAHAHGEFSLAIGNEVIAHSFKEIVMGTNNTYPTASDDSWVSTDRLFTIGNGTSSTHLSDALIIQKDGTTELNGSLILDPQNNDHTSYVLPEKRSNQTGLLMLDANTGLTSWTSDILLSPSASRLIGLQTSGTSLGHLRLTAADRLADHSVASSIDLYGTHHSANSGGLHLAAAGSTGELSFATSNTTRMRIDSDGNTGIGVSSPTTMLEVAGKITTHSGYFQGLDQLLVPDYVFEAYTNGKSPKHPDYQLADLDEVKTYIQKYKHLEGSQHRALVAQQGYLDLSQQFLFHWEKIEELFLYVIALKEELEILKRRVK